MPKRRAITIDDLFAFRNVSDPQISPDGSQVIYTQTETDDENNRYTSNLWIVSSKGSRTPRPFTFGKQKDRAPRWSPDGKWIIFISDRSGEDRFYLISSDGGEAMPLDTGKVKPAPALWSPDGKQIAFVSKPATADDKKSDVLRVTRRHYKQDGEGFWDGGWKQVFVMDVALSPSPLSQFGRGVGGEGSITQLTSGDFDCADPAWSPDGKEICFSSNRDGTADTTNVTDLWAVSLKSQKLRRITQSVGPSSAASFSPDGQWIAYYAHDNQFKDTTNLGVWLVPADGKAEARNLTRGFDYSMGTGILNDMRAPAHGAPAPIWSKDGRQLFFLTTIDGTSNLYTVSLKGTVQPVTCGLRQVYGYSYSPKARRFAFASSEFTLPCDIYAIDDRGRHEKRLTEVNKDLLAQLELCEPQHVEFTGAEGWPIEGWVMPPRGLKRGKRYPLILEIHGGPHAAYGCTFFHEMQLLSALGYGVLFTNPRGSVGYGQKFVSATHHDWGGNDYRDCMAAVDWALANLGWVDPARLGVTGGSYGGYVTNWIITQTDRFKAAISDRSISNRHSKFGSADISYFDGEWEFDGDAFDNPKFYLDRSPITYVHNVKTPLLIQHSENDLRCPIEQAEQFFVALKKIGQVPVEMTRYPGESHDMSRNGQPKHRQERLAHIVRWFGTYLAP